MEVQNIETLLFDSSPIDEDFLLHSGFSPNSSTKSWVLDVKKMHRISVMCANENSIVYLQGLDRHGVMKCNDLLESGVVSRGRINQLLLAFDLLDLSQVKTPAPKSST